VGQQRDRCAGVENPIGLILCGSCGGQVVELLPSSQTNRMQLAQITAAYEQLHEGVADSAADEADGT